MGLCNFKCFLSKEEKDGYAFLKHNFALSYFWGENLSNVFYQYPSIIFFSVWSYDKRNHINQCIFSMEIGKFEVSYYDGSFFSFFLQSLFVEVVPQVETYSILHKVWIFMEEGPHQLLQICLKRNLSQLLLLLSI